MSAKGLTAKQQAFVDEYLVDMNASAAARRAGYSPKTAFRSGQENMQKPAIIEAIEKAKNDRAERTKVTADMVVEGLLSEATYDGEGATHSARVAAWSHLGKHIGMFVDKKEVTGAGGGPQEWRVELVDAKDAIK